MTTTTDTAKTRTITLTDRPPVTIQEDAWPTIASARDREFDSQYEFQATCVSKWYLGVRQHADGRALVYATYSYCSERQGARDYRARAGVLLPAADATPDGLVAAIARVSARIARAEHADDDATRWETLSAECIADLPPVRLV